MEPRLFKYIWRHSQAEQIRILAMVLVSLPFYFFSLNLPKGIINRGVQGEGFEGPGSTQLFLAIDLPLGEALTGGRVTLFEGVALDQPDLLVALSLSFLLLVFINGGFKFVINTSKGLLGERMLRRLRYELGDRLLRFPIPYSRKLKQAEVATMIKDEVEPLGGFIGDAYVAPVFLGGQAVTAMAFILVQNLWLGLAAGSIVLFQAFLIPRLRAPILRLGRQRQLTARALAGRIAELLAGAVEIQAHDASNLERADLSLRLGRAFAIRYEIFRRKFFVKFINNFLAQFTPFAFYLGGGLLAIYGQLDIGALVAVIAAYKDLPGPIKELIDWDQQRNDVQIKYEQVIAEFQPDDILDPEVQDPEQDPGPPFAGELVATGVTLVDDGGDKLLDSVGFSLRLDEHVAIVGDGDSGKEYLAPILAGLARPSSGSIRIAGRELSSLPQAVTGRRMAYVGQGAYLFPLSVRENLLYGLMHRPLREADGSDSSEAEQAGRIAESLRSGNSPLDRNADWVDYAAAGATGPEDMTAELVKILSLVDLEPDIYRLGLVGTIDVAAQPQVAEAILAARRALPERLAAAGATDLVVRFDPERYNSNSTLAENLLFGTPTKPEYAPAALPKNRFMTEALAEADLIGPLRDMGVSIARTMVEIFADLPPGHPFFEQFSFIDADELPDFRALLAKVDASGVGALEEAETIALRRLPLGYVEARHRLGLIDLDIETKAVATRNHFAGRLAASDPEGVALYRPDAYNAAATLQDNVLFGRLAYGRAGAEKTVGAAVTEVLDSLGLRQRVVESGLGFQVGTGGQRLSPAQRQKIGLARGLLRRPDLMIVDDALAVLDEAGQRRLLDRILAHREGQGVIWTLQRPGSAEGFERVLVMQGGRIVEQGSFTDLNKPGSALNADPHDTP